LAAFVQHGRIMPAQAHHRRPVSPEGRYRPASDGAGPARRGRAGGALITVVAFAALGCRTTHDLGRASDPATYAELEKICAGSDVHAHVQMLPGTPPGASADRVQKLTPDGLWTVPIAEPATLVPLSRVRWVSRYDHAHGARNGALIGGILALLVSGTIVGLGIYAGEKNLAADGGRALSDPKVLGPALALLGGVAGALVGAGIGGLVGYEDRYIIVPETPVSVMHE
jgi:hypothetical protein